MATKYFGPNGDNGNTGDAGDEWETFDYALANTSTGDTLVALDGVNVHASDDFEITDGRTLVGDSYRGATFQRNGSGANVFRLTTALTAADTPVRIEGIVVDGTGTTGQSLNIQNPSSGSVDFQIYSSSFTNIANYAINLGATGGRLDVSGCSFSGSVGAYAIVTSASATTTSAQTINISNCLVDIQLTGANDGFFKTTKVSAGANALSANLNGLKGTIDASGTGLTFVITDIAGSTNPVISGCDLTVNYDDDAGDQYCLLVRGRDASTTTAGAVFSNNILRFYSPQGYGLMLGYPLADGYTTGGVISGNTVIGKYYIDKTPHNILLGENSTGSAYGNITRDGFVGILCSRTTTADVRGNLAIDCYGPSYYIKGCDDATLDGNIAVVSTKYVQRNVAILSVRVQNGVNNVAATIKNNVVIVQGDEVGTDFHALAEIGSASDSATFSNNTYILPDTVDIETDLFGYQSTTPNNTLAEWNTNTSANDRIILLPQAEIDALVSKYRGIADAASGIRQHSSTRMGLSL